MNRPPTKKNRRKFEDSWMIAKGIPATIQTKSGISKIIAVTIFVKRSYIKVRRNPIIPSPR
ncbi:hypothetical protein J7L00_01720, partial [Candidatus Bathyarchaeota archaeon]|nr:hypothetical protein [Candidatus Bathyarchaeota archaeon]